MTRSLSRFQALVLGFVVLVSLSLATWGLFAVDSRHWLGGDPVTVYAAFSDIGGIAIGDRVWLQGMDAGEVEAISPPEQLGDPIRVRLKLAGRLRHLLRADSQVQVARDGLLSGRYLKILPGSPHAPLAAEGTEFVGLSSPDLTEALAHTAVRLQRVLDGAGAALDEYRKGEGPIGQTAKEMKQTTARLDRVLGQAESLLAGIQKGEGTLGKLVKNDSLYSELTGTLQELKGSLYEIRRGEGTLGKLVKGNELYYETLQSLQEVRRMVSSVQQNSDAIKSLPVVRNYVVDPAKELFRPDAKRSIWWFSEARLFQPGRAVLTDTGRGRLDEAAGWLKEHKQPGTEILVVAFADPKHPAEFAKALTDKQSQVVVDYLRNEHKVHRTGFWWWSTRPVRPLSLGNNPPVIPGSEQLPSARIELLVFVPETSE